MARAKGLHIHPIKDGVFSVITKGFATDEQILGKPIHHFIKTEAVDGMPYRRFNTGEIEKGVYLVLEKLDIFGANPTYQVLDINNKEEVLNTYNIYRQN